MKHNPSDRELMCTLEPERPAKMLANFALALVFGAASALAGLELRTLAQRITIRVIAAQYLAAAQPAGFANMSAIVILCAILLTWLTAFMIVWRHIEKAEKPLKATLMPTGITLALFAALHAVSIII